MNYEHVKTGFEKKKTPIELMEGGWMIMEIFIFHGSDNSIKSSKPTSMGKVEGQLIKVEGGIGMKWQDKLQVMSDEEPNIVAQPISNFNMEKLLLDAVGGDEDEDSFPKKDMLHLNSIMYLSINA